MAIKEVTDRIPKEEYSFDMITLRFDPSLPKFERFGNIDIFRIGFTYKNSGIADFKKFPLVINKYLYPFWALAYAIVLHRRKPYDAVMTTMTSYSSFATLFFKFLFPWIKYIARADDGDPFPYYESRARIAGPLFRMLFTKADFLVVVSSYLLGTVRSLGYKGPSAIVPNGVDVKYFSQNYPPEEISKIRRSFGFEEDSTILITTSRLVKKNAVDDVIRALPLLPSRIKFVIGGIGPDMEMLKKLTREKEVSERVNFLGQIKHSDSPKYLKACDIYIRPSLSEGFGIVFVEAMAAELPVIATQEGGIADFLYDPENNPDKEPTGLAVKTRDPEGISKAVLRYMNDVSLRARIVGNARKLVPMRYDWNLVSKMMKENVLDRVLK